MLKKSMRLLIGSLTVVLVLGIIAFTNANTLFGYFNSKKAITFSLNTGKNPPSKYILSGSKNLMASYMVKAGTEDVQIDEIYFANNKKSNDAAIAQAELFINGISFGKSFIIPPKSGGGGIMKFNFAGAPLIIKAQTRQKMELFITVPTSQQAKVSGLTPAMKLGRVYFTNMATGEKGFTASKLGESIMQVVNTKPIITALFLGTDKESTPPQTLELLLGKFLVTALKNENDPTVNKVILKNLDIAIKSKGYDITNLKIYPADLDKFNDFAIQGILQPSGKYRFIFPEIAQYIAEEDALPREFVVRGDTQKTIPQGQCPAPACMFNVEIQNMGIVGKSQEFESDIGWSDGETSFFALEQKPVIFDFWASM